MDKNTLVAFFLISLVLIFTPKYMELVSPASTETKSTDSLFVEPTPPQVPVQETKSSTLAATRQTGQPVLSSNPEEIISIKWLIVYQIMTETIAMNYLLLFI